MTHVKNHSILPSNQPEVYNKDLEKLVETLQDKLEGAEIREEHLKEKVKELQKLIYRVSVILATNIHETLATYYQPSGFPICFFSHLEEADDYVREQIKSFREWAVTDKLFLSDSYSLYNLPQSVTILSWTIDSISIGTPLNKDPAVIRHRKYNKNGDSIL